MNESEMPRYKCHKQVWALKIESIDFDSKTITPTNKDFSPFKVNADYLAKHKPESGGYYVVYNDGYQSFSPANAFEEGYSLV